jgi:hypothetical protein
MRQPPESPSENLGPAWREVEIEDGASLFFPGLVEDEA